MKKAIIFTLVSLLVLRSPAQTNNNEESQEVKPVVELSHPQPRLNEFFKVSLAFDASEMIKGLDGEVIKIAQSRSEKAELSIEVHAAKIGKQKIGPFEFTINGKKYVSNSIDCEVIEALPPTDKGLWFRVVRQDDVVFIITEQRIPSAPPTDGATTRTSTGEPEFVRFKDHYGIPGLVSSGSTTTTSTGHVDDSWDKSYKYLTGIYRFSLFDNDKKEVVITKEAFDNLPAGYDFKDIVIKP